MRTILAGETLKVPDGVTVSVNKREVLVKGPRGALRKSLKHIPADFTLLENGRKVRIEVWHGRRKDLATIMTAASVFKNMFTGVTKGYCYELRAVYAHFPLNMTISENDTILEVRNFLGEKRVRRVRMLGSAKVYRSNTVKDCLLVVGNDINEVSQSAALIHETCLVRNKDIRKFLDGIYVSAKTNAIDEEGVAVTATHKC
jgi:large subunit ribosomal protein L9e